MTLPNAQLAALSAIDALLAKTHSVDVRGETITLHAPTAGDVNNLYDLIAENASADGVEGEDADARGMRLGTEMSVRSLMACIPGLDRERAERLLPLSGGTFSPLAQMARSLCGLDQEQLDERQSRQGQDRPFS